MIKPVFSVYQKEVTQNTVPVLFNNLCWDSTSSSPVVDVLVIVIYEFPFVDISVSCVSDKIVGDYFQVAIYPKLVVGNLQWIWW